jgi:hypothetical protein
MGDSTDTSALKALIGVQKYMYVLRINSGKSKAAIICTSIIMDFLHLDIDIILGIMKGISCLKKRKLNHITNQL